MPRLIADYHTHTIFSHGTGTVEDNVLAAIDAGLETIAITDHGPYHLAYGIRKQREYLEEINRCKQKYRSQIRVLSGIEINLIHMSGKLELPPQTLKEYDIRIFGYHKFILPIGFQAFYRLYPQHWLVGRKPSQKFVQAITRGYIEAMKTGLITIIAHPGYGIAVDIGTLAQACREYGVYFELNSSHHDLSIPTIAIAAKQGCQFVLSSDAHTPTRVGDVQEALDKAIAAQVPLEQIVNLESSADSRAHGQGIYRV